MAVEATVGTTTDDTATVGMELTRFVPQAIPEARLVPPLPETLVARAAKLAKLTTLRKLTTEAEFQWASKQGSLVAAARKEIAAYYDAEKDEANKRHKAICAEEKRFLGPLKAADGQVRLRIEEYAQEERERRRIEAEAAARQAATQERERLLAEAARLEAEAHEAAPADAAVLKAEAEQVHAEASTVTTQAAVPEAVRTEDAAIGSEWIWEWVAPEKLAAAFQCDPRTCPEVKKNIDSAVDRLKDHAPEAVGEGAIRVTERAKVRRFR